jgi:DNA-binding transcriptional MerR regulator
MNITPRSFTIVEASRIAGIEPAHVVEWIEHEWITPAEFGPESPRLDDEDVSRLRLIRELRADFGANDDAIPVILHLLDQLCALREEIHRRSHEKP